MTKSIYLNRTERKTSINLGVSSIPAHSWTIFFQTLAVSYKTWLILCSIVWEAGLLIASYVRRLPNRKKNYRKICYPFRKKTVYLQNICVSYWIKKNCRRTEFRCPIVHIGGTVQSARNVTNGIFISLNILRAWCSLLLTST